MARNSASNSACHWKRGEGRRKCAGSFSTYIGDLFFRLVLQDFPQDVDGSPGLDGDAGEHAVVMNVAHELLRTCLRVGVVFRLLRCGRFERGLVVEAVEVAAGLLEFLDPFLGLCWRRGGILLATI